MKQILLFLLVVFTLRVSAQKNPTDEAQPIVAEGKQLYRSEMASWYGTDLFLENYKDRTNIGGYFSYMDDDLAKCIFFSGGEKPKVIGTISFESTYDLKKAKIDLSEREFSEAERPVFEIRQLAMKEINSDSMFRIYPNTSLNLIPLVNGQEKKVYVLTGPAESGVVIFGNDYLLSFDSNNKLLIKKQLHKNILPIRYDKVENGQQIIGGMHNHLPETGGFITATDICTLMLYAKFAKWKTYNVISKEYLNVWNCETNELTVIPRETIDKINKETKKRDKGKDKE